MVNFPEKYTAFSEKPPKIQNLRSFFLEILTKNGSLENLSNFPHLCHCAVLQRLCQRKFFSLRRRCFRCKVPSQHYWPGHARLSNLNSAMKPACSVPTLVLGSCIRRSMYIEDSVEASIKSQTWDFAFAFDLLGTSIILQTLPCFASYTIRTGYKLNIYARPSHPHTHIDIEHDGCS